MIVPGPEATAALLMYFGPRPWSGAHAHARAVAEVQAFLAARIAVNGNDVDRSVVEGAALLHDDDKVLRAADAPDAAQVGTPAR